MVKKKSYRLKFELCNIASDVTDFRFSLILSGELSPITALKRSQYSCILSKNITFYHLKLTMPIHTLQYQEHWGHNGQDHILDHSTLQTIKEDMTNYRIDW